MSRPTRIPGTYRKTVLVLPSIDDDLDDDAKNRLAARNVCAVEGRCPECGTFGTITPDADYPGIWHWTFEHEDGAGSIVSQVLLSG